MNITTRTTTQGLIITVHDTRVDAAVAIEFKEAVRTEAAGGTGKVILDLSQVTFLDSSGLGAVVAIMKLLGKERPLELAGLTPPVAKVFRLTRMDSVFTIHDSLPDNLKAVG
ncbi:STAS domain-containing protein [Pararhodobacter oceanensis]|uniref:Anti-sigma factor antagonist n=1 Tax=Pararhodobacter oceanensis TaxID=2172121 RepID=A0A2T8HR38_9RHOB|nr:STAS domain-containing protein [Pararhodobacter oceanensis]PVH27894.1 anti-sigma factor antagonist [Pararhodobacter oceanensis]